jgi:hypothetical protein
MMMVRSMMRLMLAFLMAAVPTAPLLAAPANPFSARLQRLDELRRHSVLRRAILDSGEPCKRVEQAVLNGPYKNLMMWTARCAPGGDYGLFIGPDASVQVRPCGDHKALGLPLCRLPNMAKKR